MPDSVRPKFVQAFSLGLYTLARPFSGLTFPLIPPSDSFAVLQIRDDSTFCISPSLTIILSSSATRLPLLLSHILRCSVSSSIMSLHLLSLSCPIAPASDHLNPAFLRICFSKAGYSPFFLRFSFLFLTPLAFLICVLFVPVPAFLFYTFLSLFPFCS